MANREVCVVCGREIPEGGHVCPVCARNADKNGAPTGYITTGDVAQMGGLRGQQIRELMQDYGTRIGDRVYLKFEVFDKLREAGMLSRYLSIPVYCARIRCKRGRTKDVKRAMQRL